MSNKNKKTSLPDPGLHKARSVAVGGEGDALYHHWSLQQQSEGLFISAPVADQKSQGIKIPVEGCTQEESLLQQLADAAGSAGAEREPALHTFFNFVNVPSENGFSCLSDVQRTTAPVEDTNVTHLPSAEAIPDGYGIRQVLRHGEHIYALFEDWRAGEPSKSQLYRQHPSDPDKWQMVKLPLPECGPAQRYSHLASYNSKLYLAMDDEVSGFQLWRSGMPDPSKPAWAEIIGSGAYDFTANAHVTAIFVEEDRMLIACAATRKLAGFRGRPVGAELIVVQDDRWGVVIGSTRLSPGGVVVPIGAMGRGFDAPGASKISSISRSGGEYLVALHSYNDDKASDLSPLWSSRDLLVWTEVKLPRPLGEQHMRLLGAYRQGNSMLFAVQRSDIDDSKAREEDSQESPESDQAVLAHGVELWLDEHDEK